MIVNPSHEDFGGLDCHKWHLMSRSTFAEEKTIATTGFGWAGPFDGLNTIDKCRVRCLSCGFVGIFRRWWYVGERERVEIAIIECPDADYLWRDETSQRYHDVKDAADIQAQRDLILLVQYERGAELNDVEAPCSASVVEEAINKE